MCQLLKIAYITGYFVKIGNYSRAYITGYFVKIGNYSRKATACWWKN